MDAILAILTFLFVLSVEIAAGHRGTALARNLQLKELPMITKLVVAFLAAFMVFALLTDRIPFEQQRITLVIVCLLLIYANLFLRKGDGDKDI